MKKHLRSGSMSGLTGPLMGVGLLLLLLLLTCVTGPVTADSDGPETTSDNDNSTSVPAATTCQNDTCIHGTCNDTSGTPVCTCESGWTGDNCTEGVICQNDTCMHGTCNDTSGSPVCTCESGWTGDNCTEAICKNDTCVRGTCNDTSGSPVCTCESGWTGDNCSEDQNECELNVCQNRAFCENREGSYECLCLKGWKGVNCEEDVDECTENKHDCTDPNERCVNTDGAYSCDCDPGYERVPPEHLCKKEVLLPFDNAKTQRAWGDDVMVGPFYIPGGFWLPPTLGILYYVSTNGYVTFNTKFSRPTMPSPSSPKLTALPFLGAYWADIDIPEYPSASGLYHAELSLADTFNDSEAKTLFELYTNMTDLYDFQPIFIGVVTWAQVVPHKAEDFPPNFQNATIQVVMATDGWRMKGRVAWRTTWPRMDDFKVFTYHHLPPGAPTAWPALTDTPKQIPFTSSDQSTTSVAPCVKWLATQGTKFSPPARKDRIACPCSASQAQADPLFVVVDSSGSDQLCSKTATSQVYSHVTGRKTMCCYGPHGTISTLQWTAPELKDRGKNSQASAGFADCCGGNRHAVMCEQYTQLFPVDDCSQYTTPEAGLLWGNGHIETIDEIYYAFNGWGEYLLLRVPDNAQNCDGVPLEIQGRSQKTNLQDYNTTVFTAFAVKYGEEPAFEVHVDSVDINLYVNGQKRPAGNSGLSPDIVLSTSQTDHELDIYFPSGVTLRVVAAADRLSLTVSAVCLGPVARLQGLMVGQSMNAQFQRLTPEEKFTAANVWALTEDTSLFVYNQSGQGDNFDTYQHPDFRPSFLPSSPEELLSALNETGKMEDGQRYCGDNVACLRDYYQTGNADGAALTKRTEDGFRQMRETLEKRPPRFVTRDRILNVTMKDGVFTHSILVQPEVTNASLFPEVMLNVQSPAPLNYTFEPGQAAGQWVLTWYLDEQVRGLLGDVDFTFVANSSLTSMAAYFSPTVVLCACEMTSECDYTTVNLMVAAVPSLTGGLYQTDCECGATKGGRYCQEDVSECDVCYDVNLCNSSATTDSMCQCPEGYEGDGIKCYEKDECLQEGTCEQLCHNLVGSYTCSCENGYELLVASGRCQDKDECAERSTNNCHEQREFCYNTEGAYVCYCRPDFGGPDCDKMVNHRYGGQLRMADAPEVGQGWSDNLMHPHSVEFVSMNEKISEIIDYLCKNLDPEVIDVHVVKFALVKAARRRRSTEEERRMIEVTFEVSTEDPVDLSKLQEALKTGFSADCTSAQCRFQGDPNDPDATLYGVDRTDMGFQEEYDLCASDRTNFCHDPSTTCETVNGTAHCKCSEGYERWSLYDHTCQDTDECHLPSLPNPCGNITTNDTQCHNTDGSYYCTCPHSYTWSPTAKQCQMVTLMDICSQEQPCEHGAQCVNTVDDLGFACRCTDGWTGPRCADEDGEAERFKLILIIVASVLGALCLVCIIALICLCVSNRRSKWPAPSPESEPKYTDYRRRQTNPDVALSNQSSNGANLQHFNNPAFVGDHNEVISKRL